MKRLSDAERVKIRSAVENAEKRTSGEIVAVIVDSCDNYAWVHAVGAISAWLLTIVGLELATWSVPWLSLALREVLFIQAVAMAVGLAIPWIPGVKRLFVSPSYRELRVHRECLATFVERGLSETVGRTGVLIFISRFEHRVEILADRGIHEKVGEGYWKTEVENIIRGIREGHLVEALCEEIEEIGQRLAEHFPRQPNDRNELPDG